MCARRFIRSRFDGGFLLSSFGIREFDNIQLRWIAPVVSASAQ
jgi:hypothetical protein